MKNEIRLALCQKISEKFGREIKNHRDANELNGELNDEKEVICINTIKRLFGFKGYNDCKDFCKRNPEKQKAIAKYVGCSSWEVLMCQLEFMTNPNEAHQKYINKPSK